MHAATLRLAGVIQHAGGKLQVGLRQRIRRGRSSEIGHRVIGSVETIGCGILQAGNHALAGLREAARLCPERGEFARAVELLNRATFGLAIEIAHGFSAQHFLQFVGDRLICGGNIAGTFHRLRRQLLGRLLRLLGGRSSGGSSGRRCCCGRCQGSDCGVGFAGVGWRRGDDVGRLGGFRLLGGFGSLSLGRIGHRRR